MVCFPVRTCMRYVINASGCMRREMNITTCYAMPKSPSDTCRFRLSLGCVQPTCGNLVVTKTNSSQSFMHSNIAKERSNRHLLTVKSAVNSRPPHKTWLDVSLRSQSMSMGFLVPKQGKIFRLKNAMGPVFFLRRCATASVLFGLFLCFSTSQQIHAEAPVLKASKEDDCNLSNASFSHGKQVLSDYSVVGIPGDGRCLFRAVVHGASICSGKPAPDESLQRELADELRARVADELIKRRKDTEWFIEGDFDKYVLQIRKPHVWGGEPELLMASHVLKMPITVYMNDEDSGGLISIAEYGQEYGKEDPIRVLYHGFGHYDALHVPSKKDNTRSRL